MTGPGTATAPDARPWSPDGRSSSPAGGPWSPGAVRRAALLLVALLASVAAVLAGPAPARAAERPAQGSAAGPAVRTAAAARPAAVSAAAAKGYRYWSFWEAGDGGWKYATQGPSVLRPADGDVLGFRFAVSQDSAQASRPRDGVPGFDKVCGGTEEKPGSLRVALALDFGDTGDAPSGERPPERRTACARVEDGATAADALAAVAAPLRYNSDSLLCAIDGYPAKGCGEQVSAEGGSGAGKEAERDGTASDGAEDGGDGLSTGAGVAAGIAVVVLLGAAGVWQARRRRG